MRLIVSRKEWRCNMYSKYNTFLLFHCLSFAFIPITWTKHLHSPQHLSYIRLHLSLSISIYKTFHLLEQFTTFIRLPPAPFVHLITFLLFHSLTFLLHSCPNSSTSWHNFSTSTTISANSSWFSFYSIISIYRAKTFT